MKNKKAQMGMDTAKLFIVGLLTLIIIGIVFVIVMSSISSTSLASDTYTVTDEIGYINATGYTLDNAGAYSFANPSVTAVNYTDDSAIGSGNFTVSDAGVITNATATNWNNVSFSYTYDAGNTIGQIGDNGTSAVVDLFTNTSTWLSLVGVAILVLIISIVILAVNRFGGRKI